MRRPSAIVLLLLATATTATATPRPEPESGSGSGPAQPQPAPGLSASQKEEQESFGVPVESSTGDSTPEPTGPGFRESPAPEDMLKIGGLLYLRADGAAGGPPLQLTNFALPYLMDVYLDARPTDRVRGMVVGRFVYDPVLSPNTQPSTTVGTPTLTGLTNPAVLLDSLFVNFDVGHTLFVTVGRQHVKWGTARIWSPTDFLTPLRLNPLAPFDPRLGTDMLKLHLPVQGTATNLYVIGLAEGLGPSDQPLRFGGAVRAEGVILGAELGASAVLQQGHKPKLGFDLSSPLGPVDIYGELALRRDTDLPVWRLTSSPNPPAGYAGQFERYQPTGYLPAATAGLAWRLGLTERNTLALGAEAFYNSVGYDNVELLPWLILQGSYQPFYAGRAYAAAFAIYEHSGLDSYTVTLTTLGNLADRSFLTRVDLSIRVLTVLTVEVYGSVPFGTRGGELRFGLVLPPQDLGNGQTSPAVNVPTPLLELGLGLRLKI